MHRRWSSDNFLNVNQCQDQCDKWSKCIIINALANFEQVTNGNLYIKIRNTNNFLVPTIVNIVYSLTNMLGHQETSQNL